MPARSCAEWAAVGTDEPDLREVLGMASHSPVTPGRPEFRLPAAAPASTAALTPLEPPWVDPPFNPYHPTIMGNFDVLDSGDGNNLYGTITCRQLIAQSASIAGGVSVGLAASGDTSGATDFTNLTGLQTLMAGTGGQIQLVQSSTNGAVFYLNQQLTLQQQIHNSGATGGGPVSLLGIKGVTRIAAAAGFAGTLISMHRETGYGTQFGQPDQRPVGQITGITIDLANAGPGSIGLDVGDGWGYYVDVEVVNGTSQPAVTFANGTDKFTGATLPAGYPVMLMSGTAPSGFQFGLVYYVVNPSGNTFQLSLSPGGAAVNGTTNGSGLTINGCVGLYAVSRVFWSEKGYYRASLKHNAIAAIIDSQVSGSDFSKEYNWFVFDGLFSDTGQQGIVCGGGGINGGGSRIYIYGNMAVSSATGSAAPPGNIAMLTFCGTNLKNGDGSRLYQGQLWTKVEGNPGNGTGTVYPYGVYSDGNGYVKECTGFIAHSLGNPNVTGQDSNVNGAEFSFSGPITGDSYLSGLNPTTGGSGLMSGGTAYNTSPALTLGTAFKNTAPNQLVCIAGGTLTGISVNGQATGLITGAFPVPAGATITVNGSVLPAANNWINISGNSF